MSEQGDVREQLHTIMENLQQQANGLKVVGRVLTQEEQDQIRSWEKAASLIHQALTVLQEKDEKPIMPILTNVKPKEGRYFGGNQELFVDLRVDEKVSGVISADLFRNSTGGRDYVASIRTTPGKSVSLEQSSFLIVCEDTTGNNVIGRLELEVRGQNDTSLSGLLYLDNAIEGLPSRREISFTAEWESEYLRSIGIELESEEEVTPPPVYEHNGVEMSIEISLRNAGINVMEVGEASKIPINTNGWGTAQLHTLMQDFAQAPLDRRAWELHLLWLSHSTRQGLLGVMFDSGDPLPRQGAAVFAKTIDDYVPVLTERKLIQTAVHELGHALNLAHRFERVVGRADSNSFMNYDWRYKGGNKRNEFWSKFNFTFDPDELEFLRHAPRPALIPGGAKFHSINYWSDGNGGYSPYLKEKQLQGFELTLSPPQNGPVFSFAQPVFLQVELTNLTGRTMELPSYLLDTKAGFLEVLIRRINSSVPTDETANIFSPVLERCFDLNHGLLDTVPHNGSLVNNLNLTFGSSGFSFAEPGDYEVTSVLAIYDSENEQELILRSNSLRIRISYPKSQEEEDDALVLLREDVGLYFALGGSDGLGAANQDLSELRDRRQGKAKIVRDPIVANIIRCEGINAGRPYTRYLSGKFKIRDGDRTAAARILSRLDKHALNAFDAYTAECTSRLASRHKEAISEK